jgi:hypothetical protein
MTFADPDFGDPELRTRSHLDLRDWFLDVTAEIDEIPARTRELGQRRRQLAKALIQALGLTDAAALVDIRPAVLAMLANQVPGEAP